MSTVKEFFMKMAAPQSTGLAPVAAPVAQAAPTQSWPSTYKRALDAQPTQAARKPLELFPSRSRVDAVGNPVAAPAPAAAAPSSPSWPSTYARALAQQPGPRAAIPNDTNGSISSFVLNPIRAAVETGRAVGMRPPTAVAQRPAAAPMSVARPAPAAAPVAAPATAPAMTPVARQQAPAPAAAQAAPARRGPSRAVLAQRQRTAQEIGGADAIRAFQEARGLEQTGAVGPRTMAAWAARNQSPDQKLALPARPTLAARPLELAPLGQAPVAPMAQRAAAAPAPQGSPLFPAPGGAPQGAAAVAPAAYAQTPPSPAAPLGTQVASRMLLNPRRQAMAM